MTGIFSNKTVDIATAIGVFVGVAGIIFLVIRILLAFL